MKKLVYFRKPAELCSTAIFEGQSNLNQFVSFFKTLIENQLGIEGYKIRLAGIEDIDDLITFMKHRYMNHPPGVADDVTQYDLYRFIKFGHGLIIENHDKQICACVYEEPYNTPDATSYTVRIASSFEVTGKSLGFKITEYSTLLAMEGLSKVKRALIEPDNYASISILMNKLGMICDGFYTNLFSNVGAGLTVCLPIDMESFQNNRIKIVDVVDYIKANKEGIDYKLIDPTNLEAMDYMYNVEKQFWAIGFLKAGLVSEKNVLFAYPGEKMNLQFID